MKVKELMNRDIICVRRSTTLSELIKFFKNFHTFPLVPVVEDNSLIGIVSFRNLTGIFRTQEPEILKTVPFIDEAQEDILTTDISSEMGNLIIVDDIMDSNFVSIKEEANVEEAYNLMKLHSKEQLPVVDRKEKLIGIIGLFDIILGIFKDKGVI